MNIKIGGRLFKFMGVEFFEAQAHDHHSVLEMKMKIQNQEHWHQSKSAFIFRPHPSSCCWFLFHLVEPIKK
ncbi:unnamed protein product [Amoebophrya sp. A120]|nr:unnamed protein product [Amoebophrya sp. A120]|eukprot:GSA120T00012013001.1